MDHVRKFVLLPADAASRIGTIPNVHQIHGKTNLSSMESILADPNKPIDLQVLEYNQQQQEYLQHKKHLDQPLRFGIHSEPVTVAEGGKPEHVLLAALNYFQHSHSVRQRAIRLGQFLQTVDRLGWTNNGEITVNGNPIPNSNLTALIEDVVTDRVSRYPIGSGELAALLQEERVPANVVAERIGRYIPPAARGQQQFHGRIERDRDSIFSPPSFLASPAVSIQSRPRRRTLPPGDESRSSVAGPSSQRDDYHDPLNAGDVAGAIYPETPAALGTRSRADPRSRVQGRNLSEQFQNIEGSARQRVHESRSTTTRSRSKGKQSVKVQQQQQQQRNDDYDDDDDDDDDDEKQNGEGLIRWEYY